MVFLIRKPEEKSSFFDDEPPRPSHAAFSSKPASDSSLKMEDSPPSPPVFGRRAADIEQPIRPAPQRRMPEKPVVRERMVPREAVKLPAPVEEKKAPSARPLFVKIGDYQHVIDSTRKLKSTIEEAEKMVARMNELKAEQDQEFVKWRTALEEVERKLEYVDKIIFEA